MPTTILRESVHEVWDELLEKLLNRPEHVSNPRGKATREILGVQLNITNMRNNILVNTGRDLNYRFMVAEWLWISMGRNDIQSLKPYNSSIASYYGGGTLVEGAYGPKIVAQLPFVLNRLRSDRSSRQAVIDIWNINPSNSADVPCTLIMQFLIRNDKLHMIVTMRSSDIWLGIPYDLYVFSQVGIAIAGELDAEPGHLQVNLGSSHMYNHNVQKAQEAYYDWTSFSLKSTHLPEWPPRILDAVFNEGFTGETFPWGPWAGFIDTIRQPSKEKALGVLKKWLDPR